MRKVLFVFGTRPEVIKMAPLINLLKERRDLFEVRVCSTGQHRELAHQAMAFFSITPDYELNIMLPSQTLFDITSRALSGLESVFQDAEPDLIFVQGDTTTVLAASLAAYYQKIKVAHLEAGLRSRNKYYPFPEEINRMVAGHIADYHFAPTLSAKNNLANENITSGVFVVGNTVIDALFLCLKIIDREDDAKYNNFFRFLDFSKKIILVTGHRRENFGGPFEQMCKALLKLVESNNDIEIVYPVHLNPNVREPVFRVLKNIPRIHLIEPIDYPHMVWILEKSYLVLTDSGGIQEEAPSLGKPVLVMRDITERQEGIDAGTALLVGTGMENICLETQRLLTDTSFYDRMSNAKNPYGDGTTSIRICEILTKLL